MRDDRLQELTAWLEQLPNIGDFQLQAASVDASFRRYFRVTQQPYRYIVMDAPPDKENTEPFIRIAGILQHAGLNVPRILNSDDDRGFLLMSDLGEQQYLSVLNQHNATQLYGDAMDALIQLQAIPIQPQYAITSYDKTLLMSEMELFSHWYLQQHRQQTLSAEQHDLLQSSFHYLADSALQQPQVLVHRDYHSRNLMVCVPEEQQNEQILSNYKQCNPGILDFQDAVIGAVSYDLVSLLRDCYIRWPASQVRSWALQYQRKAQQAGIFADTPQSQFIQWFDLMGLQRHLKAIGIFARLNHRDHKADYLKDIPRTLRYIMEISSQYPALAKFHQYLHDTL